MGLWKNVTIVANAHITKDTSPEERHAIYRARAMIKRNKELLKQQKQDKSINGFDWS